MPKKLLIVFSKSIELNKTLLSRVLLRNEGLIITSSLRKTKSL